MIGIGITREEAITVHETFVVRLSEHAIDVAVQGFPDGPSSNIQREQRNQNVGPMVDVKGGRE